MRELEIALIEWPDGREAGGPRVIGHVTNPEIVAQVRKIISSARRRELVRLEPPVRSTRDESGDLDGDQ